MAGRSGSVFPVFIRGEADGSVSRIFADFEKAATTSVTRAEHSLANAGLAVRGLTSEIARAGKGTGFEAMARQAQRLSAALQEAAKGPRSDFGAKVAGAAGRQFLETAERARGLQVAIGAAGEEGARRFGSAARVIIAEADRTALALRELAEMGSRAANLKPALAAGPQSTVRVAPGAFDQAAAARINASMTAAMREAAQAEAELTARTLAFRSALDPAFASQQRLNAELAEARALLDAGRISQDEHNRALTAATARHDQFTRALGAGAGSAKAFRAASANLGFQINDITQSVALGVAPMTIFAQQAGQTAFALSGVGGVVGRVATFLSGPWGAAILGGATVLGVLVTKLWESDTAADAASLSQQDLARYYDATTGAINRQVSALSRLAAAQTLHEQGQAKAAEAEAARQKALRIAQGAITPTAISTGEGSVATLPAVIQGRAADQIRQLVDRGREGGPALEALAQKLQALGKSNPDVAKIAADFIKVGGASLKAQDEVVRFRAQIKSINGEPLTDVERRALAIVPAGAAAADIIARVAAEGDKAATATERYNAEIKRLSAAYADGHGTISRAQFEAGVRAADRQRDAVLAAVEAEKKALREAEAARDRAARAAGTAAEQEARRNQALDDNIERLELQARLAGRVRDEASAELRILDLETQAKRKLGAVERQRVENALALIAANKNAAASAEQLARIRERYAEQPSAFRQAQADARAIDRLVGKSVLEADGKTLRLYTDADAAKDKAAIQQGLQRPYAEFLEQRAQERAISEAILAGREDEAEALRLQFQLAKAMGPLDDKQLAVVRAILDTEHERNRALEQQRRLLEAAVSAADGIQASLTNAIRGALDGDYGASIKRLGRSLGSIFKDLQAQQLSVALFGDLGSDVRDALTRASSPLGQASVRFDNATERFERAVNGLVEALTANDNSPTAAQAATTPTAYGLGRSGALQSLGLIGTLVGGRAGGALGSIASLGSAIFGGARKPGLGGEFASFVDRAAAAERDTGLVDGTSGTKAGTLSDATVSFIEAAAAQESAAKSFGLSIGEYGKLVQAARSGNPEALFNLSLGKIGAGLEKQLGIKGLGAIGAKVGTGLQYYAMADMLTDALGIKGVAGGAIKGAAAGFGVAGPIGAAVGALVGGVAAALKKTARAYVELGTSGSGAIETLDTTAVGKAKGQRLDAARQSGAAVTDMLNQIAERFGASLAANFRIGEIGSRKGKYVFDESPEDKTGQMRFDTAEEAVRAAISSAIDRGIIQGIRESTRRLLTAGSDFEAQLDKAAKFEDVFRQLEQMKDPTGFAIKELDREFDALRKTFAEAQASAAELAQLEELYGLKRQQILEQLAGAAGTLEEQMKTVARQIREIENPTGAALDEIGRKFDELKASLTKAGASAADLAQAEKLFALQRDQLKEQAGVADLAGQIKAITDPVGHALDQLDERFADMREALTELGGSTEEFAQLDQLYGLQRAEAIRQATQSTLGALRDFLSSLKTGSESGLSLSTRRTDALAAYQPLAADLAAGRGVDGDAFVKAAQTLLGIEREMFGSTKGYFDRLSEVTNLTERALGQPGSAATGGAAANDNALQLARQATVAIADAVRTTFAPQPGSPVFDVRPVVNAIGEQTRQVGQRLDRLIEQQDNALSLAARKPTPASPLSGPRPGGVLAPTLRF